MPSLSYTVADFIPFTRIISADVNSRFADIKNRINWSGGTDATTGLGDSNIQSNAVTGGGLTRATKLKLGLANGAVYNDSTGAMVDAASLPATSGGLGFVPSFTGNAGQAVTVNNAETGFILGSPSVSQLTQSFASDISSLTAGEAIAANDAVCLDLSFDASSNYIYRVFKSDSSVFNRSQNHLGFAIAAANVTAGSYTWVASANFVTGNSITFKINGRQYTVPFNTNNTTTLQAVATAMATDQDINGAVSDGSHTVTITGKGGLFVNITGSVVTGGASQPAITVTTVTPPTGQNVRIRNFGDLGGFTLTPGYNYYLATSGGITNAPTGSPVFVGQALSSSVLFVNRNVGSYQFTTPVIFARSHGTTTSSPAAGTQDVEHYNFTAWSAGTSSAVGVRSLANSGGDQSYAGCLHQLGGYNVSATVVQNFQKYNKTSWSTLTNNSAACAETAGYSFAGYYYRASGVNSGGGPVNDAEKWDGSAWATLTSTGFTSASPAGFTHGGYFHVTVGTGGLYHVGINSSDIWSTFTNPPTNTYPSASSNTTTGGYYVNLNTASSYKWNGSWGTAVTVTYTISDSGGLIGASGFNVGNSLAIVNGGCVSATALSTSAVYNDTTWAAATSSSTSRAGGLGGVF